MKRFKANEMGLFRHDERQEAYENDDRFENGVFKAFGPNERFNYRDDLNDMLESAEHMVKAVSSSLNVAESLEAVFDEDTEDDENKQRIIEERYGMPYGEYARMINSCKVIKL